jgi:DNA processing protein
MSRVIEDSRRAIAIVGARDADAASLQCTRDMTQRIARAGIVVVSGGAEGIDAAAHETALDCAAETWCIAGTACDKVFPKQHAGLFKRIANDGGAMVWPYPKGMQTMRWSFLFRNRILAALSDGIVVVQAREKSGSLHAACEGIELGRPVYVLRPPAWGGDQFEGGRIFARRKDVRVIERVDDLYVALGLAEAPPSSPQLTLALDDASARALAAVGKRPQHLDEIAQSAGLPVSRAATLLLTLALENVVVEGPSGFYRRA